MVAIGEGARRSRRNLWRLHQTQIFPPAIGQDGDDDTLIQRFGKGECGKIAIVTPK